MTNGYMNISHELNAEDCILFIFHIHTNSWESTRMLNGAAFECLDGWSDEGYEYVSPEKMRKVIKRNGK